MIESGGTKQLRLENETQMIVDRFGDRSEMTVTPDTP